MVANDVFQGSENLLELADHRLGTTQAGYRPFVFAVGIIQIQFEACLHRPALALTNVAECSALPNFS